MIYYIYAYLGFILQILIAYFVQQLPSLRLFGGDFGKWLTYICPLYRLGDYAIGCCFGFLFRKREDHGKISTATILEVAAILIVGVSHFAFLKANVQTPLTTQNWYALDVLYLPPSLLLILVFARNRGWIYQLLSAGFFVFLGDLSPYMFLIYQIVIKYLQGIWRYLFKNELKTALCSVVALVVSSVLAMCWVRIQETWG